MVVAVDFDGTLFENVFPDIGQPKWDIINFVKNLKKEGNTLILWTCRVGKYLQEAVDMCKTVGLDFDYVNQNVPERNMEYNNDSRKIGADIYIDDRSVNPNFLKNFDKIII
ncbi:MAG: hypothetical protein PHQ62_01245 [Clostridia bacterium]|nr:hypothetical protein [Clostridia bacterium]